MGQNLRDNPEKARRWLEARRAELARLIEGGHDAAATVELDQARLGRLSRMDALQQQAMAREAQRRRRQEIGRIEAALERLDAGEYGWCVTCGEPIADARLELDPACTRCIACAGRG